MNDMDEFSLPVDDFILEACEFEDFLLLTREIAPGDLQVFALDGRVCRRDVGNPHLPGGVYARWELCEELANEVAGAVRYGCLTSVTRAFPTLYMCRQTALSVLDRGLLTGKEIRFVYRRAWTFLKS